MVGEPCNAEQMAKQSTKKAQIHPPFYASWKHQHEPQSDGYSVLGNLPLQQSSKTSNNAGMQCALWPFRTCPRRTRVEHCDVQSIEPPSWYIAGSEEYIQLLIALASML
jgi:hypothetical protein